MSCSVGKDCKATIDEVCPDCHSCYEFHCRCSNCCMCDDYLSTEEETYCCDECNNPLCFMCYEHANGNLCPDCQ